MGTFRYQWQRRTGSGYADIPGAPAQRLTPRDSLRGREVRVVVTFLHRAGHRERLVSASHAVPYSAPSAPRIRRVLSGRPGGDVTARVVWSRPASTRGAGISGYKVVALELRQNGSVAGETSSRMLAPSARALTMRLDRGRYRFVVRAYNVNGASDPSRSKAVVAR